MDRNREVRRLPMAAGGNGVSRRRHRAGSFRESPEDVPVELPETTRLRDRGGSLKKERDRQRDRLSSRSKRRRGERLVMVHGNLDDGGDESSEESVNDDEEYDDGGGGGGGVRPSSSSLKMLPPVNISPASFLSSLPNHHHHQKKSNFPPTKIFRSPPSPASWKAVDEMIGVAVPRKARSACTKRPHESWSSNGGVFASGEQINRTSPAPTSPSSSNVSARKKMLSGSKQKPLPPKSSSPVAVQDEIEIEIAEVLYGMNRMPLAISKQETTAEVKSQTVPHSSITLAANSSSCNVSATAPRRKKPRHVKYDDENCTNFSNIKSEAEASLKSQLPFGKRPVSAEENSSVLDPTNPQPAARETKASLDSNSAEKKEIKISIDDTVLPKVESSPGFRSDGDEAKSNSPEKKIFEIDLMEAKPLLKEEGNEVMILESEEKKPRMVAEAEPRNSEINCELKLDLEKSDPMAVESKHHVQKQPPQQQVSVSDKTAQAGPLPLHMSMPGWPGGLPTMGYMPPTRGVVSTDTGSLSSAAMQPPLHLLFNQPRPKRCATHCYIARNILSHQQFTKMNPFWHAAAGSAPLYGTKACNVSLMTPTDLQGSVLGRSSNSVPDKNSQSTSKSSDTAQRNQILLQQALPPGAANNIMHGPTFIFPMGQQPHGAAASVRPNSGNTASSGPTATSNSMNGSASANPAGAQTMSFSYPGLPGNETQYLAILQNNGYPFPVPAHVGAPPAYRGAPGQPIPFFNGSFYSSQMMQPPHLQQQKQQQQQPGQMLQIHAPSNQNGSVSNGSSVAQKHLQNQQLRPPVNHGNSQGFPTHKVQSQPMSFQQRQQPRENATQNSETVQEVRPSAADSRGSQSSVAYVQNYGMQMQPTNMSSAGPGGVVVRSSSNHGESKSQQQGSKAGMESFQSQGYAMNFNGANNASALNMSSIAQNQAMFHRIPEAARQGYQMMAVAQQKMNYSAPLEDGRSGSNASASTTEERRKSGGATGKSSGSNGGQSIAFSNKNDLADASAVTSNSIVDSSSRLLNLGSNLPPSSSSMPASHHQQQQQQQQHMQRNQLQQTPYTSMYLHKQQQYATSVAASAARTKAPVASNRSGFPDHSIAASPVGATKFPQNLVQSSSNQVQSPQWKNNSPRSQSPSMLSPSSSVGAARNVSHKQQSRPQQSQISFAANSKPIASGSPMQQNQAGSPSTSSVSKTAGGGSKPTTSASSAVKKAGQASSAAHSSSQPSKNSQSASVAAGAKSQQQPKPGMQPQGQLFFSNPFMQPPGGYYIQRHQQQQSGPTTATTSAPPVTPSTTGAVTATSDPAKAIAAAAAAMGKTVQQHQLVVPPGFPYVPSAIQAKPVDQKQQAGE